MHPRIVLADVSQCCLFFSLLSMSIAKSFSDVLPQAILAEFISHSLCTCTSNHNALKWLSFKDQMQAKKNVYLDAKASYNLRRQH